MIYRNLGDTGLKVSELGLGCSSIGNSIFNYGEESEFIEVLNFAFENGINFFDTADTYAFGNSETLIGKVFKNKRDKVIIATKVGFLPSSLSKHAKNLVPFLGSARKIIKPFKKNLKKFSKKNQNFSAEHILLSVERSLSRLKTDYIDLYQLHSPPADIINQGDIFNILDKLKSQGKIRYYGVSAANIEDAVACLNFTGVSVLQVEFNLIDQKAAFNLFPFLERKQKGIIVKIPLARGLLTEKMNEETGLLPSKISPELVSGIQNLENTINKKIFPEAAIRFILNHKEVSTVIAGTKSLNHLKENLKMISAPSLNNDELEQIFSHFSLEISKSVI